MELKYARLIAWMRMGLTTWAVVEFVRNARMHRWTGAFVWACWIIYDCWRMFHAFREWSQAEDRIARWRRR